MKALHIFLAKFIVKFEVLCHRRMWPTTDMAGGVLVLFGARALSVAFEGELGVTFFRRSDNDDARCQPPWWFFNSSMSTPRTPGVSRSTKVCAAARHIGAPGSSAGE